jgi:hypothetical protein
MAKMRSDLTEREAQDAEHRDFYVDGLPAPPTGDEQVLYDREAIRITLVNPSAGEEQHFKAAWIADRAAKEMPYLGSPYPDAPEERRERRVHALLAQVSNRLVGIVILVCRHKVYVADWVGDQRCARILSCYTSAQGWWTVGFAWIYPSYRRRRLVTLMLQLAAEHAGASSPAAFAWEAPFSADGRRLVDGYRPSPLVLVLPGREYRPCDAAASESDPLGWEPCG